MKSEMDRLQAFQNRVAKNILGKKISSSETLNSLQWIPLVGRRFAHRCSAVQNAFSIGNTTSDISKLLYVISRAFRRVKFETILKYHEWPLCEISRTNHAIICLYYHSQYVCYFHMWVFQIKLKYHCSKPIKLQKFLM